MATMDERHHPDEPVGPSYSDVSSTIIIVDEYQASKSKHHVVVDSVGASSSSSSGDEKKSRKINKFFKKKDPAAKAKASADAESRPLIMVDERDAYISKKDRRETARGSRDDAEEREGGGGGGGGGGGYLFSNRTAENSIETSTSSANHGVGQEVALDVDISDNDGANAKKKGARWNCNKPPNEAEYTDESYPVPATDDDNANDDNAKEKDEHAKDTAFVQVTGDSPSSSAAQTGATAVGAAAAVGGTAYILSKKEEKQKAKRRNLFCKGKDDDADDEDDMPLNAHDDETKSILSARSALSSSSSLSSPRARAAAAGGAYLFNQARNDGRSVSSSTVSSKKSASSKKSTSSSKRDVPQFFATKSTNSYRRSQGDDASTVVTPVPDFFAFDEPKYGRSPKSGKNVPKTIGLKKSSSSSSRSRKSLLLFGAVGAGAGAAAVAARRSRKGRQNAVNTARKNTGRASKGSLFIKKGLKKKSFVGHRVRVMITEQPPASEAAFGGPPRYDWIDVETAAAVKAQAAWRRYKAVQTLESQGLTTANMRNRRRAKRWVRQNRRNTKTDGCGLDGGCGLGTHRGVQNDDAPDFMACLGLGNLL